MLLFGLAMPARCATVVVQEVDFAFNPPNQTVNVGDTIVWTNVGASPHTTTSGTSGTPDGLWDSGNMNPQGPSFPFTFNVAGTYPYYCTYHYTIGMVGSVTVQGAHVPPSVSITSPANAATFPAGSSITVQASASSTDGTVTRVDFFENGNLFGSATTAPYSATFSGGAPGPYALTAVATDDQGASSTSPTVNVTIQPTSGGPTVAITSPANGQVFPAGTNILVQATASENGGTISQVQFLVNNAPVGTVTTPPYNFLLTNVAAGGYVLTATATDNMGASATSPAVNITVQSTNGGPIVTITSPVNGQNFPAGTNILIQASASDGTGTITQVQFFTNNVSIGTVTNAPYDFLLTGVAAGNYALTAKATDNTGASGFSPPVSITVGAQTNLPPTVVITEPTNGSRFPANATITVSANANSAGGQISQVAFFLGTNSVGVVFAAPFQISLSNLRPGSYSLTAKATDNNGRTAMSSPVSITVFGAPTVTLTKPVTNSVFPVGNNVSLAATASTTGQKVVNVEFLVNGSVVAEAVTNPYTAIWVPTAPGIYSLTAVAVDEFGQSGSSAPVQVRIFIPESTRPTIKITKAPPNTSRVHTGQISIFGTAQNKIGIDRVEFQVNGGVFHPAIGTNTWQANVTLTPGKNAVGLRSVNLAGNTSVEVFRYYTYVVEVPLTVKIFGPGSVKPDLNGKPLQIGNVFHVTAIPNPQALFTGWTGAVSSMFPALSFQMQSNLVLNATFVPNPFIAVAGQYTGLILNSNGAFPANSAFLTLQLAKSGTFSGKLAIAGASYGFHEQFSVSGSNKVAVMRPGLPPVALTLQLDLANNSNLLTGSATDGTWVSPLFAERNVFNASSAPPETGPFSFVLARTPDEGGATVGRATAFVHRSGTVLVEGKLTNGRTFSQSTALSSEGDLPFYLSLSHGVEVMIGVLNVSGSPAAVTGSLFWSKAEANGFSTTLLVGPP
jgi:plastocyanin